MEEKTYYIVWNEDKTEGFITSDQGAALNAHWNCNDWEEEEIGQSSLGLAFSEFYRVDVEDMNNAPEIEVVRM